jgi:hypothetical protein
VFDILQLDANDAITVQPQHCYGDQSSGQFTPDDVLFNRLNLVLLQRYRG